MEDNRFNDEHDDENDYQDKYMDGIDTRIPSRGTGLNKIAIFPLTIPSNHLRIRISLLGRARLIKARRLTVIKERYHQY